MAKVWGDKSYDEDFYEINAWGERQSDQVDKGAHDAYYQANPRQQAQTPWSGPAAPAAPAASSAYAPLDNAVMGKLVSDIGHDGSVNTQDPVYQQQVQANQLQTDRHADRSRAAMAQRRAATGTGTSGAVDTDANKVLQEQAFQDKTFEGNLMDKFRTQNLDKAARALTLGSGMLTAEQERALRASLTREGYSLQDKLAANDLSFRRDALGQQAALSMADLDSRAMMAILNGG